MKKEDIITVLKDLALKHNLSVSFQEYEDGSLIDASITGGNIDIDITIPRHNEQYYAYSIESSSLPREFYFNSKENGFTSNEELQRSKEVLLNLQKILDKQLEFHSAPSLLNKNKGYIIMTLDGKETKVYQKYNAFGLPVSSNGDRQ